MIRIQVKFSLLLSLLTLSGLMSAEGYVYHTWAQEVKVLADDLVPKQSTQSFQIKNEAGPTDYWPPFIKSPRVIESTVAIQTSIFGDAFRSVYVLSHTDKNEIFDNVHFTADLDTPEFINIKVPEKGLFHSITILISNYPDKPEYYHNSISCHTIWDNQKDTISTLGFSDQPPKGTIRTKNINVKVTVEGIGKLDDIFSLSTRSDLTNNVSRLRKGDIEINIDSYNTVGRLIYLVNRKDKSYKEIVIHPESSAQFSQDFTVQYTDLGNRNVQEILDFHTNDRVYVQINANTTDGSVYNLYSSPGSLEELDGLRIDPPLNLDIISYDATIISRDFRSSEANYNMVISRQTVENIQDIVLPEIIDVSNFVTGDPSGYMLELNGIVFDKWILQYAIKGLVKSNVHIPWEYYRNSNWFIYGVVNDKKLKIFIPVVTEGINEDIFGDHGYLLLENDNWNFIRNHSDNHREINSYKKE